MRIFIDNSGFFYKAPEAKDPSHAERPCITQEFLEALADDGTPMLIVDIEEKVRQILNTRAEKKDAPTG